MTHFYYLMALLVSIGGLLALDVRLRLVWWHNPVQALRTILPSVLVFIVWDLLGVGLAIFLKDQATYMTGVHVGPLPLEEFFFLYLLIYSILIAWEGSKQWFSR